MNYLLMSLLILNGSVTLAGNIVDVHGLEHKTAQKLLQTYVTKIQTIETLIMDEFLKANQGHFDAKKYDCLIMKKNKLLADIKQEGPFAFVDLQTVYYQNDTIYTTLEVIDDPKSDRMRFVTKPSHPVIERVKAWRNRIYRSLWRRSDVISQMQAYDALTMQLTMTAQLKPEENDCPAYHCLSSFHHPRLQPYWDIFQKGVTQEKQFILTTLRYDPDPERRAAAAFLVGHFSDPKEIVTVLGACVDDSSSLVRNNALRVIALTLLKSRLTNIDCMPFITLLESPFVTDRNKALSILLGLVDDPVNKEKMIRYGGHGILSLLHLSQPDNHDLAYALLKKMSRQRFGAHQFSQWQAWLQQAQGQQDAFR